MITIIHGDDTSTSRNYFLSQKINFKNSISFSGEKLTLTELVQVFEGGELFSDDKNVFIEELFSKRKPSKELTDILIYLNKNKSANIFFWENKILTAKSLSWIKNAVVKEFKFPKTIFLFLDSIKPGNGKRLIELFHETLKTTEIEIIVFMIIRQLRLLLALHEKSSTNIEEVNKLQSWQKGKLEKQSKYFDLESLKKIYKRLFEIDLGNKTGNLNMPLIHAIDFFLLDL
ncbi:MAG: hypothetical protein M1268_03125 [Patescibacteria group bacterium]|nr:hypothetical protein [Patescibacteria group bacterium]